MEFKGSVEIDVDVVDLFSKNDWIKFLHFQHAGRDLFQVFFVKVHGVTLVKARSSRVTLPIDVFLAFIALDNTLIIPMAFLAFELACKSVVFLSVVIGMPVFL